MNFSKYLEGRIDRALKLLEPRTEGEWGFRNGARLLAVAPGCTGEGQRGQAAQIRQLSLQ